MINSYVQLKPYFLHNSTVKYNNDLVIAIA